jgi:membrane protein YqaA with SNARE-associated domain
VRSFLGSVFRLFLSAHGLVILSALDSSMIFFLPTAIDTAVVIVAARNAEWFWVFPILAVIGSVIGTSVTYMIGRKIGEAGLSRWLPERRLKRVRNRIDRGGVAAMGFAALIPPPFPLTAFVLTGGALGLNPRKFFAAVAMARLLRFGLVSVLAVMYGRQILSWLESDTFEYIIGFIVIVALAGTVMTIYQLARPRAGERANIE